MQGAFENIESLCVYKKYTQKLSEKRNFKYNLNE